MNWAALSPWWHLLAFILILATLPGTLYLAALTLAGLRRVVPTADQPPLAGPVAIVVPAHNEAAGIARTVDNLLAIARADGAATVCVVADNCGDDTAAMARARGADVLERHDLAQRGKGYALDHAFGRLAGEGFVAYVVIDADTLAESNLLAVLRRHLGAGAMAVQTRYAVLNADQSPRTRLAELALCAFNALRPRGRHALGWSAGILGNGFALTAHALRQVPYQATSVVEDLEYHLRLLERGLRVHFADETTVRGDMPLADRGQATQRARWEGGRLRMLLDHGTGLLRRGLSGQWRFLEPLLDLLLPPLAYHTVLLLALCLIPLTWARGLGLAGLALLALHVLAAAWVGGLGAGRLWLALRAVPEYLWWKLRMLRTTLRTSKTSAEWERTHRDTPRN
jgi:cellulose synthase/poly-beta-1,6-N-acetylglucosamine synthase-like glycosyltransferase